MTAAKTFSRIFRRSTWRASRPSKRARRSASTWCKGQKASRPRTSRKSEPRNSMKAACGRLFYWLEVDVQAQAVGVDRRLRLEDDERRAADAGPLGGRLAEAIAVVVARQRPLPAEAIADLGVEAGRAAGVQLRVGIEADVGEVRVLDDVQRILHAAPGEEAAAALPAVAEFDAQAREGDVPLLLLHVGQLAVPVVEAQAGDERRVTARRAVDSLQLGDGAGVLGRAPDRVVRRKELGAVVLDRAAVELA